jgi:hypothetical protein
VAGVTLCAQQATIDLPMMAAIWLLYALEEK